MEWTLAKGQLKLECPIQPSVAAGLMWPSSNTQPVVHDWLLKRVTSELVLGINKKLNLVLHSADKQGWFLTGEQQQIPHMIYYWLARNISWTKEYLPHYSIVHQQQQTDLITWKQPCFAIDGLAYIRWSPLHCYYSQLATPLFCSWTYIYIVWVDFYWIHHIVVGRNQAPYCIPYTSTCL